MLGITEMTDADYPLRGGCGPGPSGNDPAGYQIAAMKAGEPNGYWSVRGSNSLNLTGPIVAGAASGERFRSIVDKFKDPETGEKLGLAPARYKSLDKRVQAWKEKHPDATPEQVQDYRLRTEKNKKTSIHAWDNTYSPPKSWSIVHAAFERAGMHDEAQIVLDSWREGVEEAMSQQVDELIVGRTGVGGPKVDGEVTTRYERPEEVLFAVFPHLVSRDGDPQIHAHVVLVNKIRMADGSWKAIYSPAITKYKHMIDATALRVAEAKLTQRLGIRFETRGDDMAREVVGVPDLVREMFSSRTRALTEDAQRDLEVFERDVKGGAEATPLERWHIQQQATLRSRRAKPKNPPTREERLKQWASQTADEVLGGLQGVARDVMKAAREPVTRTEDLDVDAVIGRALEYLEGWSTWNRSHLYFAVNRFLPDNLAVAPARVVPLLTELTDRALQSVQAVSVSAPPLVRAPKVLRDEKSGRSVFQSPASARWTTKRHLEREDTLVGMLGNRGAPRVEEGRAREALGGFDLSEKQMQAAVDILTSDRQMHMLVAAAGAGKTRMVAAMSSASEDLFGHGVTGFTTAQSAAEVMSEKGVDRAFNVERWLTFHRRDLAGETSELEQVEFAVQKDATVVFDESSMLDTGKTVELVQALRQRGASRFVLAGDTEQVGAVGAVGAFELLIHEAEKAVGPLERGAQEGADSFTQGRDSSAPTDAEGTRSDSQVHRLDEVHRFAQRWERDATVRVREGDASALNEYEKRGRLRGGDTPESVRRDAAHAVSTDVLAGVDSMAVTRSRESASELSSFTRQRLVEAGHVEPAGAGLRDSNVAGVGDRVTAKHNDRRLPGGPVFNQERYEVVGRADDGALTVRQVLGVDGLGQPLWGSPRELPADYVSAHVELSYAGTVHAVQGRDLGRGHPVVEPGMSAHELYPAMTRGQEGNWLWVVPDASKTHQVEEARSRVDTLSQRAAAEAGTPQGKASAAQLAEAKAKVAELEADRDTPLGRVAAIVGDDSPRDTAARITIERDQDRAANLGNLGPQWQSVLTEVRAAEHRGVLSKVLGVDADAVFSDEASSGLFTLLRHADSSGHDVKELVGRVMGRGGSLSSAVSPAAALASRVEKEMGTAYYGDHSRGFSYESRVPAWAEDAAHRAKLEFARDTAREMDKRTAVLGQRAVDNREPWLEAWKGPVPADPAQRVGLAGAAAPIAAYREQYGITDQQRPLGPMPGPGSPEQSWAWNRAADVYGIAPHERMMSALSEGALAGRVREWELEQGRMPPNVDDKLRTAHLAREEAREQLVEAQARGEDGVEQDWALDKVSQLVEKYEYVASVRAEHYEAARDVREQAEAATEEQGRRGIGAAVKESVVAMTDSAVSEAGREDVAGNDRGVPEPGRAESQREAEPEAWADGVPLPPEPHLEDDAPERDADDGETYVSERGHGVVPPDATRDANRELVVGDPSPTIDDREPVVDTAAELEVDEPAGEALPVVDGREPERQTEDPGPVKEAAEPEAVVEAAHDPEQAVEPEPEQVEVEPERATEAQAETDARVEFSEPEVEPDGPVEVATTVEPEPEPETEAAVEEPEATVPPALELERDVTQEAQPEPEPEPEPVATADEPDEPEPEPEREREEREGRNEDDADDAVEQANAAAALLAERNAEREQAADRQRQDDERAATVDRGRDGSERDVGSEPEREAADD